jgi:MYXO-CTERM domain-containing protein
LPVDTDGDSVPDYRDLDTDNDGIADLYEGGSRCPDANDDGICDGDDTDRDGIVSTIDAVTTTPSFGTSGKARATNTDGDDKIDARDLDSDADKLFDSQESKNAFLDADKNGVIDATPDRDGDGILDVVDDSDLDHIADDVDPDPRAFGGLHDSRIFTPDGDDDPDFQDPDSDDDEVTDGDDNCRIVPNGEQEDLDGDGTGDACDLDDGRSWGLKGGCSCETGGDPAGTFVFGLAILFVATRRRRRRRPSKR